MKTLILSCTRRSAFVSGYVDGLLACMASEHFAGWAHLDHESDIARGRGKLLTEVLANSRADAFLWIDDDIVFTRDDFDTIVRAPVDIIGGHYVLRHDSQTPCYGTLDVPLHTDPRIVAVDVIVTINVVVDVIIAVDVMVIINVVVDVFLKKIILRDGKTRRREREREKRGK